MSIGTVLDAGLAALVLAVAWWATVTRVAFAAVAGFVIFGSLLAIVWVRLGAVDVALTEAAIGSGLTGALLVAAEARLRPRKALAAAEVPGLPLRIVAALLCAALSGGLALVVLAVPDPAPTLAPLAVASLPATGLGNPVTAVLMAYRALDTLLEKVVLVLALVGVWSLSPDLHWNGIPGPRRHFDPQGPLTLLARLLPPVGVIVAVHLVWVGANEPGGAFPGATVLAAMWLLVMIAGLAEAPPSGRPRLRLALVAGAATFIAVGLLGVVVSGAFLAYPPAYAKPLIVLIEIPATLSVAMTLALLLAGPPARMPER